MPWLERNVDVPRSSLLPLFWLSVSEGWWPGWPAYCVCVCALVIDVWLRFGCSWLVVGPNSNRVASAGCRLRWQWKWGWGVRFISSRRSQSFTNFSCFAKTVHNEWNHKASTRNVAPCVLALCHLIYLNSVFCIQSVTQSDRSGRKIDILWYWEHSVKNWPLAGVGWCAGR